MFQRKKLSQNVNQIINLKLKKMSWELNFKYNSGEEYLFIKKEDQNEEKAEVLDKIIACEKAIYAMRRTAGCGGYYVDLMSSIRSEHISHYDNVFESNYECSNDYY